MRLVALVQRIEVNLERSRLAVFRDFERVLDAKVLTCKLCTR
jgi:hypothetical protein